MAVGILDALSNSEEDDFSGAQTCMRAEHQRGAKMYVAGVQCMHGHGQRHELRQRVSTRWRFFALPDTQKFPGALEAKCLPHKMLNTSQNVLSGTQSTAVVSQLLDIILNPLTQVRL